VADPSLTLLRRSRAFRWYWAGQSLSFVGTQVTAVALPLVAALTLGAGPAGVGVVATAAMLPNLAFSLLVGNWVEGRDHRRVMIPADLVRAVLLAAIPVAAVAGWLSVPLLVVVAFLAGVAGVFFEISGFAYVPQLVTRDELAAGNRAVQGSSTTAQVAGPGLAGLLVQAVGPALAVAVDALSYLASAVGVLAGRPRSSVANESAAEPAADNRQGGPSRGLRLLLDNPYLRALTVHAAIYNLASQILTINLVLWLVQGRGVSPGEYGLALSAEGVGAVLGTLTALQLAHRLGFGRAFAVSLLLSCFVPLLLAALPLSGSALAVAAGAVLLIAGLGLGNANIYSLTLRQTVIPGHELARTVGAYRQVMYGSIPIGSAAAGVIGQAAGTHTGVVVGTLGLALSALPMLARRIRTLPDPAAAMTSSTPA
jgi:Na+/melibiose symporter-like transporter